MDTVRLHGKKPYRVVAVHGGPGAAGDLYPVANNLSEYMGIIEALQTRRSIKELVDELNQQVHVHAGLPLILIGHSWGAWLSFLYAARFPRDVKKLILIDAGGFKECYAHQMMGIRASRLSEDRRYKIRHMMNKIQCSNDAEFQNQIFKDIGKEFSAIDAYQIEHTENPYFCPDYQIYKSVWEEATGMRRSGYLLEQAQFLRCPVVAIHGDHDPHPYQGVSGPLNEALQDFKMILLENCGHSPWLEKYARDRFYEVLKAELK